MLGITNPYSFEIPEYLGYNISKFKSYFRVLEICLARKGKANGLCPLYFNGAINYYEELPLPNDTEALTNYYNKINMLNSGKSTIVMFIKKLFNKLKK